MTSLAAPDAIDRFGRSGASNNALYRKFGIKQRTLVEDELELGLPAAAAA